MTGESRSLAALGMTKGIALGMTKGIALGMTITEVDDRAGPRRRRAATR